MAYSFDWFAQAKPAIGDIGVSVGSPLGASYQAILAGRVRAK
jgi:hypothetical protein